MKYFIIIIILCVALEGFYSVINKKNELTDKNVFTIYYGIDIFLVVILTIGLILSFLFIDSINSFYNSKILVSSNFILLFAAIISRVIYVISNSYKLKK